MQTNTLSAIVSKDPNSSDLSPLVSNSTYAKAVDAELALLEDASIKAQALTARNEDLRGMVQVFSQAITGLKGIATRFPEAATPINEAQKQVQLAMGLVANNPPPPPETSTTGLFSKEK